MIVVMFPRLHVIALALSLGLIVVPAFTAGSDTGGLIRSLQKSDDFRVRTQAALALGGSKSKEAIQPLCAALGDENASVRAAAAAGLGRLHLGGDACLERQRKGEKSPVVQSAIKKAIAQLRAEPEPEFTRQTQYYVAVGKITDNSGHSGTEVTDLVRKAMRDASDANGAILLAPASETTAQATKRLAAHKGVKGLYLMPRVGPPQYTDKGVKLKIEVAYLTYPGKALLGM